MTKLSRPPRHRVLALIAVTACLATATMGVSGATAGTVTGDDPAQQWLAGNVHHRRHVEPYTGAAAGVSRVTSRLDRTPSGGAVLATDTAVARGLPRAPGATPQVHHSGLRLQHVVASLNNYAKRHGVGQVQRWRPDLATNTVTITVNPGANDHATRAFLTHAQRFGSRVRVVSSAGRVTTAAFLYDGQSVSLSNRRLCTIGFNATIGAGRHIFLTAGHCALGLPTASRHWARIGGTLGYRYPISDYAAISNDTGYWRPQGAVDMHNGYARPVYGHKTPPVGARVCKSGQATGWTCGRVTAHNVTVNYGNGALVYGLVQHTACVEPGDSGGPNLWGNYAAGLTSGGRFYQVGNATVCGQKVGRRNLSFYQPILDPLNAFGAKLTTH